MTIKNDIKYMLRSEYNQLINELFLDETDKNIFNFKFIQGKSKKEISNLIGLSYFKTLNRLTIIEEKLNKIAKIKSSLFSCDNASEFDIKYRCNKLQKSKEYTNFCVDCFVNKFKNKELANKYFIEIETVKKYKRIRRQELENLF